MRVFRKYTNRSRFYIQKGDYDRAISDCNKAIEVCPNSPDIHHAYYFSSIAHDRKGLYELTAGDAQRAYDLEPNDADYIKRLGIAKTKYQGDTKRAVFIAAINRNPKDTAAYINLAAYHADNNNIEAAIANWEVVLNISPNHAEVKNKLAEAYFKRGQSYADTDSYAEAVSDLEQAVALIPGSAVYKKTLADIKEKERGYTEGKVKVRIPRIIGIVLGLMSGLGVLVFIWASGSFRHPFFASIATIACTFAVMISLSDATSMAQIILSLLALLFSAGGVCIHHPFIGIIIGAVMWSLSLAFFQIVKRRK